MASCKLSGKKPLSGNNRPWSKKATRRTWQPNIQQVSLYVPELGRSVRVRVAASEIRTIQKVGLEAYLRRRGKSVRDLL
jgi:large subunit ribosomal protein L28